jgi:hypothetical protein
VSPELLDLVCAQMHTLLRAGLGGEYVLDGLEGLAKAAILSARRFTDSGNMISSKHLAELGKEQWNQVLIENFQVLRSSGFVEDIPTHHDQSDPFNKCISPDKCGFTTHLDRLYILQRSLNQLTESYK